MKLIRILAVILTWIAVFIVLLALVLSIAIAIFGAPS